MAGEEDLLAPVAIGEGREEEVADDDADVEESLRDLDVRVLVTHQVPLKTGLILS